MNIKNQIIFQLRNNFGFGDKATSALNDFNLITGGKTPPPNNIALDEHKIQEWESQLDTLYQSWIRNNKYDKYISGRDTLEFLQKNAIPLLQKVATNESPIALDSIKYHPDVKIMKDAVESFNNATILINESIGKVVIKPLDKKIWPNASYIGQIQNTFITIGKRLNQISTWAIIILCLFIDLIVPLAIYILLRKKEDDPEENPNKPKGPVSF